MPQKFSIMDIQRQANQYAAAASSSNCGASYVHGSDRISVLGYMMEPFYEIFVGTQSVALNNTLLYSRGSVSVDNCRCEAFTEGKFTDVNEAWDYLAEKFSGVKFEKQPYYVSPHLDRVQRVWENPAYAAEHEASKEPLQRFAFRYVDKMERPDKRPLHAVEFVKACDLFPFDIIEEGGGVSDPWLVTKDNSDSRFAHCVYLNEALYARLCRYTNDISSRSGATADFGNSTMGAGFTGVIEARSYTEMRNACPVTFVDLSRDAEERGDLRMPSLSFDAARHDAFVRRSQAYQKEQTDIAMFSQKQNDAQFE